MSFSDASNIAAAAFIKEGNQKCIFNFTAEQRLKSSTWRELKIVHVALDTWCILLAGRTITWYTDNQPITYIIHKGSMTEELNILAMAVLNICTEYDINLRLTWILRLQNKEADAYGRCIDRDDWGIRDAYFAFLDQKFGPHDFDRFANARNKKCKKFNSLNWEKDSEGINALSFNWAGSNNWVVPPTYLLLDVVNHIIACRANGTIVMPEWSLNPAWPLLMPNRFPAKFVKKVKI